MKGVSKRRRVSFIPTLISTPLHLCEDSSLDSQDSDKHIVEPEVC